LSGRRAPTRSAAETATTGSSAATETTFLVGGAGNDWISGGPGADALFGGDGEDVLDARDNSPHVVDGGKLFDAALVDRGLDQLRYLEHTTDPEPRNLARGAGRWHGLCELQGDTHDDEVLYCTPHRADAVRYFRIVTRKSPSWVAWKEIQVLRR